MTDPTKIDFRYRQISQIDDITDLVEMLFPGNRNQQHAAARILLALKSASGPLTSLNHLVSCPRDSCEKSPSEIQRFVVPPSGGRASVMSWGRVNAALRTGRPVIETVTGLLSFHTYFWDRS